jgi:hypothetical protein
MEIRTSPPDGAESPNTPAGGVVKPVYSERTMKCLTVTESELKQIGLANLGVTICVGIGSALVAFGIDVFKDSLLATDVPDAALMLTKYVQPMCLIGGVAFYVIAVMLWIWRKDMIGLIRRESGGK